MEVHSSKGLIDFRQLLGAASFQDKTPAPKPTDRRTERPAGGDPYTWVPKDPYKRGTAAFEATAPNLAPLQSPTGPTMIPVPPTRNGNPQLRKETAAVEISATDAFWNSAQAVAAGTVTAFTSLTQANPLKDVSQKSVDLITTGAALTALGAVGAAVLGAILHPLNP